MEFSLDLFLEISAVVLGFVYLILMIKENILCWFFGIASSFISIFLFIRTGLYSESILYVYYVVIGFYGYNLWRKGAKGNGLPVTRMKALSYPIWIGIGIVCSFGLGYFFSQTTDAVSPYFDSTTTIFSFIASYLEAKKKLEGWLFWIVINFATIALYWGRDLNFYTILTVVYFVFSIVGYIQWKKSFREHVV